MWLVRSFSSSVVIFVVVQLPELWTRFRLHNLHRVDVHYVTIRRIRKVWLAKTLALELDAIISSARTQSHREHGSESEIPILSGSGSRGIGRHGHWRVYDRKGATWSPTVRELSGEDK